MQFTKYSCTIYMNCDVQNTLHVLAMAQKHILFVYMQLLDAILCRLCSMWAKTESFVLENSHTDWDALDVLQHKNLTRDDIVHYASI